MRASELTGKQKAAIMLISLGPELSSKVFKHLSEEEIEELTLQIASTRNVSPEMRGKVLGEFYELGLASEYISTGGIDYAQDLLKKALGEERAQEIIAKLTSSLQVRPFDVARKTDPAQLLNFIQNEHPQTIALIMAYLQPDQAATILSSLSEQQQVEVAKRLATLDRTTPEVLSEIETALEKKLANFVSQDYTAAGGIDFAVEVLNRVDRTTEKTITDTLEIEDPELAEEIKRRMFLFEDLVLLEDRYVQRIIREVDSSEWAKALKTASDEVLDKIFRNMSKRAAEMLKEEMEYLGPMRLRDVEETQQRIVGIIRQLEDAGEIILSRGGEDEVLV